MLAIVFPRSFAVRKLLWENSNDVGWGLNKKIGKLNWWSHRGKSRGPNSGTLPNGSELVSSWYSSHSVVLLTSAPSLPFPTPHPRHSRWRSRTILERGHTDVDQLFCWAAHLVSLFSSFSSIVSRPMPPYRASWMIVEWKLTRTKVDLQSGIKARFPSNERTVNVTWEF